MPAHIEAWVARVGEHTRGRKCLGSLGQVDHHHIGKMLRSRDSALISRADALATNTWLARIWAPLPQKMSSPPSTAQDVKPSIDWLDHLRRSLEDPHPRRSNTATKAIDPHLRRCLCGYRILPPAAALKEA